MSDDVIFPAFGWNPHASRKKRTAARKNFYNTSDWKDTRLGVFKRDRWMCFVCGEKGGFVNAHHIIPVAFLETRPSLLLDKTNLVTLCRRCHNWVHELGAEFFNPYKPAGTIMRSWRFAEAYFFIMYHWPEFAGGIGERPKAIGKPKKSKKKAPKKKPAKKGRKK